ncbi:MAG: carboxypeptidase M32 [Candidatus Promineifilaceae bacterium]
MNEKLQTLKQKLSVIDDIRSAAGVLQWDQSVYMPNGGAAARGRQMATLGRIAQEMFIDDEIGHLLDDLKPYQDSLPYDDDDASLLRVVRRNYERAVKVPPALIAEITEHTTMAYQLWAQARPNNDFASLASSLEKTVDLSRQVAERFEHQHIADPLIDMSDFGMNALSTRKLFAELRRELVPLVAKIGEQALIDSSVLYRNYPIPAQSAFGEKVIKQYGYDFERGRQDLTLHPFMTKFSLGDVRITTRFQENDVGDGLFSTLHESGHAMYEQGINPAYEGTVLANGTSSGVHESQSRLWENIVGRSRGFWEHYYPQLQESFADQLGGVSLDHFYRAINRVTPSLVRVDADEVTYNLHVMIRFDLELALLEGSLAVKDLPDAWHARYESDLGMRAPDDRNGVLQDVHWYAGLIGGSFQGYTLGNVMSAAFYEQALAAEPGISAEISQGNFDTLHGWLKTNIYQHGAKYTAPELVERVTGGPLSIDPYINYLKTKFGDLYQLS